MKRLIITLTIAFSVLSISSYANEVKVSPKVLESFRSSFSQATEIEWTAGDNYYKATFVQNSQHLTAFFDADGQFLAVTKNITSTQLPVKLQTSLKEYQEGLWITNLFEVAKENGTSYYVTLENADTKIVLRSSGSSWNTYQKLTKS